MTVKVEDNVDRWWAMTQQQYDIASGMMAQDVEMIAAFKVPVDEGTLSRFIRKLRVSRGHWKVTVNKNYAEYQERGMRADGTRRVRNYSRAGSGPHFLREAVDVVVSRKISYLKRATASKLSKVSSGTDFG